MAVDEASVLAFVKAVVLTIARKASPAVMKRERTIKLQCVIFIGAGLLDYFVDGLVAVAGEERGVVVA
jgi:hypothetical protein